jgi:excisionase family DNA binding protein
MAPTPSDPALSRPLRSAPGTAAASALNVIADGRGRAPAASFQPAEWPTATEHRLLTAGELAARWQVPTSHVYRLTRESKIPAVRLGRYYRYRLAAIEAWERDSEAPAVAAA